MGSNSIAVRAYSVDLAQAVGEKPAMFIHQLHYWLNRPRMGYMIDGQRFIKNTYEQWTGPENFPHWTVKTVQRVVKKLEENGLLVVTQLPSSYDRTLFYTPNYYSSLLLKCGYSFPTSSEDPDKKTISNDKKSNRSGQNEAIRSGQKREDQKRQNVQNIIIHRIPQRQQQRLHTKSSKAEKKIRVSKKPSSGRASQKACYRDYYKIAQSWLNEKESDFKKAARVYVDKHCNKPNVSYPMALKQKIIVEIWRKYTGKYSITDFEYVDREYLKRIECPDIQPAPAVYQSTLDDDMMRLYKNGDMYA